MTPAPELLELVLSEFQRALREHLQGSWSPGTERPPRYGYIEQTNWTGQVRDKGKAIAAWHIAPDIVRACRIRHRDAPHPPKVDAMFYDLFQGWFCFADDLSAVAINWQTGPRFGRGLLHRIGKDTLGRYLLDRGTTTWVS
ncbi:MAG: hypothetical protein WCA17_15235 [Burkholderiales bacterium]